MPPEQIQQPEMRASLGPFTFSKLRKQVFLGVVAIFISVAILFPIGPYLLLTYTVGGALSNTPLFLSEWNQAGFEPANLAGLTFLILFYLLLAIVIAFLLSWPANLKRDAMRVKWRNVLSLKFVGVLFLVIALWYGGLMAMGYISGVKYRNTLTSDAGKECTDSSQCESYCVFFLKDYDPKNPNASLVPEEGERVVGECHRYKNLTLCETRTTVENGLAKEVLCDDYDRWSQ